MAWGLCLSVCLLALVPAGLGEPDPVPLLYYVGIEGSGHHYFLDMFRQTKIFPCIIGSPRINRLVHSRWRYSPANTAASLHVPDDWPDIDNFTRTIEGEIKQLYSEGPRECPHYALHQGYSNPAAGNWPGFRASILDLQEVARRSPMISETRIIVLHRDYKKAITSSVFRRAFSNVPTKIHVVQDELIRLATELRQYPRHCYTFFSVDDFIRSPLGASQHIAGFYDVNKEDVHEYIEQIVSKYNSSRQPPKCNDTWSESDLALLNEMLYSLPYTAMWSDVIESPRQ